MAANYKFIDHTEAIACEVLVYILEEQINTRIY
jgi:hypothetical protein